MSLYRVRMRVDSVIHAVDAANALDIAESVTATDGVHVTIESLGQVTRYADLPEGITGDNFAMSAWEYKDLPEGKQPIKFWLEKK